MSGSDVLGRLLTSAPVRWQRSVPLCPDELQGHSQTPRASSAKL